MKSTAEIVALYRTREQAQSRELAQMRVVCDMYNSDLVMPMPEVGGFDKPAVANYIANGLDQTAMRIADPTPNVMIPPLRPGIKKWADKASMQRRALLGHWEQNNVKRKLRRRARWFAGYGSAPVVIRPLDGYACWEVRSPLRTFPAPSADPDCIHPDDCIFTVARRHDWLCDRYPEAMRLLFTGFGVCRPDEQFTVLEYCCDDEWVTIVLGREGDPGMDMTNFGSRFVELERIPNRTGIPPAVVPGRITLDRPHGQFDGVVGMYQTMAKLMALSVIATQKGIIRDEWLVAHPNENPEIVSVPDPYEGRPGVVKGGNLVPRDVDPQFQTSQTVDRIERALRETSATPTEFGGSSSSGTRTARRGAQLLAAVVDFPVAEAQEMFAASLEVESRLCIETEKAYFGSMPRSFHVRWKGARGQVDFTPSEMWADVSKVDVSYAFAGMDTNSLVVEGGQRVGQGTMSKRKFMEIDPFVDDVEEERDRIIAERLDDAFLTQIQTLAADPQGPFQPVDLARITELVKTNDKELYEAVQIVQREAQDRQASAQQAPAEMPGLSMPGQGVEAPPAIAGPDQSMSNLNQLLMSLRGPQMTGAA